MLCMAFVMTGDRGGVEIVSPEGSCSSGIPQIIMRCSTFTRYFMNVVGSDYEKAAKG